MCFHDISLQSNASARQFSAHGKERRKLCTEGHRLGCSKHGHSSCAVLLQVKSSVKRATKLPTITWRTKPFKIGGRTPCRETVWKACCVRHTQTSNFRSLTHDWWAHTPCSDEGLYSQPVRDGRMHSRAISSCMMLQVQGRICDTPCVGCMHSCVIQTKVSLNPAHLKTPSRCLSLIMPICFSLNAGGATHAIPCCNIQEDRQSRQRRPKR